MTFGSSYREVRKIEGLRNWKSTVYCAETYRFITTADRNSFHAKKISMRLHVDIISEH